jgi:hypothetical protein
VKHDLETLPEFLEGPGIVLARMVAGEIGRGDVGDSFGVDADKLGNSVHHVDHGNHATYLPPVEAVL